MQQLPSKAVAQDAARETALTIGGLQLDLIEAHATIRDLRRQLETAQAEADGLRSEAAARGNVVPMPGAA